LIAVWRRLAGGIISEDEYTLTPSTSWTVDTRTLTAPNKAATMSVRMQATASAGSDGNVYVDEITMDLVGQIFRVDGAGNLMVVIENDSVPIDDAGGSITVDATDLDIRDLSKAQDEVYSVLRTDAGAAYDARDRNWTITEKVSTDPDPVGLLDSSDNRINPAKEDGNLATIQADIATIKTKVDEIEDALDSVGTDKLRVSDGGGTLSVDDGGGSLTVDGNVTVSATDLDIRDLSKAQDEVYSVLRTDAGVAYDARDISDRAERDLGKVDIAGFDVSLPAGTNNIGDVDIASIAVTPQTPFQTTVTTAGTPVQLASHAAKAVLIQAMKDNTGYILVGTSNTTCFIELAAESAFASPCSNTNEFWIDSTVNGEGVNVYYVN